MYFYDLVFCFHFPVNLWEPLNSSSLFNSNLMDAYTSSLPGKKLKKPHHPCLWESHRLSALWVCPCIHARIALDRQRLLKIKGESCAFSSRACTSHLIEGRQIGRPSQSKWCKLRTKRQVVTAGHRKWQDKESPRAGTECEMCDMFL